MSNNEIHDINRTFPEIASIQDPTLRSQVTACWIDAWHQSQYATLEDAIFSPQIPGCRLIDHVRAVTSIAMQIAKVVSQHHHIPVNHDYVLAGALLHDIDKLIIYEKTLHDYQQAKILKQFPHGYLGARIAHKHGIPDVIEHLILSHTRQQLIFPTTIEAIIVHYADFADYDALAYTSQRPLLLEK
ncbi:MAG: HD domain-containing protein [Candidatus Bathyarchaeota archaeon]|nr:HD domain-containing protein [Candidatus Bathyarchaeota archaeon]